MIIRPLIARAYWARSKFTLRSENPPASSAILIGAPHTSNWDLPIMFAITWRLGLKPKWLGKKSIFKRPFGRLMRALGGIPVDRTNPAGLVEEVAALLKADQRFFLVIAPEGTRERGTHWKSGFYRIARQTGLPVVLGFVDSVTMTAGLGPTLYLTDDVTADMDQVREYYADKRGINPEGFTPPLLRDEK